MRRLGLGLLVIAAVSCRERLPVASSTIANADLATEQPQRTIFFHWGTTEANAQLLSAGGFRGSSPHFNELNTAPPAAVNAGVMQLVQQWFEAGGRSDALGPGVYIASTPNATAGYGRDLLVVRVKDRQGAPIAPGYMAPNHNQAPTTTDLYTRYTNASTYAWYSISRAPTSEELVTIAPPSREDAPQFWQEHIGADRPAVLWSLVGVLMVLEMHATPPDSSPFLNRTRSAKIFLERVAFDEGYAYILAALRAADVTPTETEYLARIVTSYQRLLPSTDSRVVALTEAMQAAHIAAPSP